MLRVLYLSDPCCPRVAKEGRECLKSGLDIIFLQRTIPDAFRALLPNQFYYINREDLGPKLKVLAPDLVHVHTEPAWLGWFAKECLPDTPVIFDAHDLNYCRSGGKTLEEDERRTLCDCDGVILPSQAYEQAVKEGFGVKLSEVIYSMVNEEDYPKIDEMPRVNGIVYEGGMGATSEEERAEGKMRYNDYRSLAVELFNARIPFHCYPGRAEFADEYIKAGVVWNYSYMYHQLLKQLTRYDWGLVGSPFKNPAWDSAMPNKLFDYVAAGIPVLVYNAEEAAAFVREHDIGIVIEAGNSEDAVKQIGEAMPIGQDGQCRNNAYEYYRLRVQRVRKEFSMASQMPKLINFYTEVIKTCQSSKSSTDTKAAAKPRLVKTAISADESPLTRRPTSELAAELF